MAEVKLKVGDTLIANCVYRDANGDPVNLTTAGITIKSSVRSADGCQDYPLTVTLNDQATVPGGYRIRGDTSAWAPGCLAWDIRYTTAAGDSSSTKTITIELKDGIT